MPTIAGHLSKLYVTSTDVNPTSANLISNLLSSGLSKTRAELDTSYQGDNLTSFIVGKTGAEVPVSLDYDPANAAQALLETVYDSGATVWVHWSPDGTTACKKIPCKVSSISIESSADGKVSMTPTLKSVGAVSTSTAS